VAEEWALVDNLSGGRVGIACASGWHANDFVLSPADYAARKQVMFERIDILERLWRGESIALVNGAGKEVEIRTFPRPLQPRLPLWIASHSDDSFIRAGEMGAAVLTALYSTTVENLERQIGLYRQVLVRGGRDPKAGAVTLMVHTFLAENEPAVQEKLRSAYGEYLFVFLGLQAAQARGLDQEFDLTEADKQFIVEGALQRRAGTRDLIGTPAECAERVEQFRRMGVDEIACLIDFGIDFESVMTSLHLLDRLKTLCNSSGLPRTAG
jgi:natural product biosynthesis luciferase-like monooxygenase protein